MVACGVSWVPMIDLLFVRAALMGMIEGLTES
jgi:hypothetical protein